LITKLAFAAADIVTTAIGVDVFCAFRICHAIGTTGSRIALGHRIAVVSARLKISHNPWLFKSNPDQVRTVKEKLELLKTHTSLFQQHFSGIKSDQTLKRFFKIYAHGFDGAAELREKLYNADNLNVIPEVVDDFLNNNPA
jgi:tRNA-dihydrouridine synthase